MADSHTRPSWIFPINTEALHVRIKYVKLAQNNYSAHRDPEYQYAITDGFGGRPRLLVLALTMQVANSSKISEPHKMDFDWFWGRS
jgi:hypothetical protein